MSKTFLVLMANELTISADSMPDDAFPSLGQCPRCAVPIPRALELIEYETTSGVSRFAECPACRDVVRPLPGQ